MCFVSALTLPLCDLTKVGDEGGAGTNQLDGAHCLRKHILHGVVINHACDTWLQEGLA